MDRGYQFLSATCASCPDKLIRIVQSESRDMVVCPTCFAAGEYGRVKRGAGLTRSIFIEEGMKKEIDRLKRLREAGF